MLSSPISFPPSLLMQPASLLMQPPVEWKHGMAPGHKPEELTGGEWHNVLLPLFVQVGWVD